MPFSALKTGSSKSSLVISFLISPISIIVVWFVIVYLDGILTFSKTKAEHLEHIRQVFQRLREEKLLINIKKCSLMKEELVYFGFLISVEGLKMEPEKVRATVEWPTHVNVGEVRSFHGLTTFYQKFIKNSNGICKPITEIMSSD